LNNKPWRYYSTHPANLVIVDTSLEILNPELYDRIRDFPNNPRVPSFMHIMVATRMARTAPDWVSLFSERNSGKSGGGVGLAATVLGEEWW
jgi:hypothetical protein